jgi:lysophospholipid acyltransferase (LPLAT)-like uncharacterized protein
MIRLIINIYIYFSAALLYLSMLIINLTLGINIKGKKNFDDLKKKNKNVIFATWHQATFIMFHMYRHKNTAIFVTSEVRGQILGKCAEWMGYKALPIYLERKITMARSTTRLLNHLKKGNDCVIAVDGPIGPLHEIKQGVFYLSRKAKAPIIPVGVSAPWKISLRWRWDKYFIPIPFSTVTIRLGKPITPQEIDKADLKKILQNLSR